MIEHPGNLPGSSSITRQAPTFTSPSRHFRSSSAWAGGLRSVSALLRAAENSSRTSSTWTVRSNVNTAFETEVDSGGALTFAPGCTNVWKGRSRHHLLSLRIWRNRRIHAISERERRGLVGRHIRLSGRVGLWSRRLTVQARNEGGIVLHMHAILAEQHGVDSLRTIRIVNHHAGDKAALGVEH